MRELEDDAGKPAYTAFLYLVDLGAVFVAGTTEVAASIVHRTDDHLEAGGRQRGVVTG